MVVMGAAAGCVDVSRAGSRGSPLSVVVWQREVLAEQVEGDVDSAAIVVGVVD